MADLLLEDEVDSFVATLEKNQNEEASGKKQRASKGELQGASSKATASKRAASSNEEIESLVAELRRSEFLQYGVRHIRQLQDEAVRNVQVEASQLRMENERLRAEFSRLRMEAPGKVDSDVGPLLNNRVVQVVPSASSGSAEASAGADVKQAFAFQDAGTAAGPVGVAPGTADAAASVVNTNAAPAVNTNSAPKLRKAMTMSTQSGEGESSNNILASAAAALGVNRGKGIFVDREAMKEQVRQLIRKPPPQFNDFFKEEGICAKIAKSAVFDVGTLTLIGLNAIWIAVDADHNSATVLSDAEPVFQIIENLFCIYFVFEWGVRFAALKRKRDAFRDSWFVFDLVLVTMMIVETWLMAIIFKLTSLNAESGDVAILKLVRMAKITRMARMGRLLRAFPEVTVLIKGIYVAARSVFFTILLLAIIIYIFAIAFRQFCDDSEIGDKYFASVPEAMKSLLLGGVLPDFAAYIDDVGSSGPFSFLIIMVFVLLASLTVMNMLVGILVEVVSVVSSVENEQMRVAFVKQKLLHILNESGCLNEDGDSGVMISRIEFDELLVDKGGAEAMQEIGVDPVGLVDFADYIFRDAADDEISFEVFIDVVLQFRGSSTCTVKDIVDLRKSVFGEFKAVEARLKLAMQLAGIGSAGIGARSLLAPMDLPAERAEGLANQELVGVVPGAIHDKPPQPP